VYLNFCSGHIHNGLELGLEIHGLGLEAQALASRPRPWPRGPGLGLEAQNLALRVEALVLALIFWP